MKILELRFRNLNSLYGEWRIDFTHPEYAANGIFALTGPTGAGKSTILDAICLALYGRTPRLGKITKSSNEIMSRRTGECYAEVLFETQSGLFRCNFSQHRARKKADGELQSPRHEIAEGHENGKIIESQLRRVAGVIEDKTGMDFERFTRSILLAQGGFDTFLKADTEQKSKILEQITGTEIYTRISLAVHERQRDEHEKLNLLLAEISGIETLTPEQEQEIRQELDTTQKQEKELAAKTAATAKAITWLSSIESLKKEIAALGSEALNLQDKIEAFKPERARLEKALKAASLNGLYATLTALEREQQDDEKRLKKTETSLPELKSSADTQAEALRHAEKHTAQAKDELKKAAPTIIKVRELDQKLTGQKKAVAETEEACRKITAEIENEIQSRADELDKRTQAEKKLKSIKKYLADHAGDEWLIGGLAGIEEQLKTLISIQTEIAQKESDTRLAETTLNKTAETLAAVTKKYNANLLKLEETAKQLQLSRDSLDRLLDGKLLREYHAEKDALQKEKEYLVRIAALEEHRAKLEDGIPCPLCGSTEHPFAAGNIPAPNQIEQKIEKLTQLISQAEKQSTAISKLEKAHTAATAELAETEKQKINAVNDQKLAEKSLKDLQKEQHKLLDSFKNQREAMTAKLQPLGITDLPEKDISTLLKSLKTRLNSWQKKSAEKDETEKLTASIDSKIRQIEAVTKTQQKALAEKQKQLVQLKQEHTATTDERRKLYGTKSPDKEELRLNKTVEDMEEAEKNARNLNTKLQQQLTLAKEQIESIRKRVSQRLPNIQKAATDFSAALKKADFADKNQFLDARMNEAETAELSARAKALDNAQTDLAARQKDRQQRLKTETAKKITDKTIEELEPQFSEYEKALHDIRDTIAALKHRLNENQAALERIKSKQAAIKNQKKEYRRWEKLHGLIGSADGKKYRNFAQGLTFELMVSHANRQLQKMTDRYLLIRDKEQPLELNVVDNYQAGEIRSTRNLSGGESFIVSLTLALGLSKMASRKVRVDSLFLDEGFGTLDEETLETALETLAGLQQDNKLIGVISHVPALKERISTQINITPLSGGRSTLTGPGCTKT